MLQFQCFAANPFLLHIERKDGMISRVIPIASAFPFVALMGGLFLFSQRISWERLVGAIMIIVGIIIIRR